MCQSDNIIMEVNTDIQMQPLDLSCPKRSTSSHYYEDEEPTNLVVMTPNHHHHHHHVISTTVGDMIDRPNSAESDSDSERPTNLTITGLRLSAMDFGPARKRFLTKYFNKDLPGKSIPFFYHAFSPGRGRSNFSRRDILTL